MGNLDPDDRWEIHAADTVGEGHFVNDPRAVEILAREAPERILELDDWGCPFSLTEDGELNQRYFGAQSFRRTCFAGDRTGEAILGTLVARAKEEGIPYREDVYMTKLLKSGARVNGAAGFDLQERAQAPVRGARGRAWPRAATRRSTGAGPPDPTRTTGTRWLSPTARGRPSRTWSSSSSTRPA